MNVKLIVEKNYVDIHAGEEIIGFIREYFDPYYSVQCGCFEIEKSQMIKTIIVTEGNLFESERRIFQSSSGEEIWIHYDQKAYIYRVGQKVWIVYDKIGHILSIEGDIIHICLEKNDEHRNYIPMRIIREILYCYLIENQFVELHAASIAVEDTGVLIVGDKGAGKTTLLLQLLRNKKVCYMSNDKTFLNCNTGDIIGYPISANICKDIVNYVPEMMELFYSNECKNHYQHQEWSEYIKKEKRTFSIKDLQEVMNFSVKAKAPCNLILMPINSEVG